MFLFLIFISFINLIYLISITSTILISLSSANWIIVWIIIEINLIIFIPLITSRKYLTKSTPCIKYFLAQAIGSIILIVFILFNSLKNYNFAINSLPSLLLMATAIKSGTPPFHFWFPQLIEEVNWLQIILLLVVQKIIPLIFIFYSIRILSILVIIRRGLIGAIGGFNQNSIKKILAYSSIVHMGWLIISMNSGIEITLLYFIFYSIIIVSFIFSLKDSSIRINRFTPSKFNPQFWNLTNSLCLFSLSGLPPFLGFFIKIAVVVYSIKTLIVILILIRFSLISIIYYIRVVYTCISHYRLSTKIKNKTYTEKIIFWLMISINFMVPIMFCFWG